MASSFAMIDPWVNPNFALTQVAPVIAKLFSDLEERRL
jgi:hypothetical protein